MALPPERAIDVSGRLDIAGLLALLRRAALLVSNDSGPAHLGPVADTPTVALFGPETPRLYAPLGNAVALSADLGCSPCVSAYNHRQTPCRDNACMRALGVDTVFAHAMRLLERTDEGNAGHARSGGY